MIRSFVAIELPEDLRRTLTGVQEELKRALPSARRAAETRVQWVRPESLHLTLKFLGDIEEAHIEPLRLALIQAVAGFDRFSVEIEGIGGFPDARAPRVIWAGLRAAGDQHPVVQL